MQPERGVDEEDGDGVILAEFPEDESGGRSNSGWKPPDVDEFVGDEIGGGEQQYRWSLSWMTVPSMAT